MIDLGQPLSVSCNERSVLLEFEPEIHRHLGPGTLLVVDDPDCGELLQVVVSCAGQLRASRGYGGTQRGRVDGFSRFLVLPLPEWA